MIKVYIGLGSNIERPEQQLRTAIRSLSTIRASQLNTVSSLYKSKPIGPQDQADYINAVAELETNLESLELLDELQAIEDQHQRVRKERWGPRTLDLDILLYGDQCIANDRLSVPHVEMLNRSFVLIPLAEINPGCEIPGAGNIKKYLKNSIADELSLLE